MGEVEVRELDIFGFDVLPDVQLSPVGERKDAEVLAVLLAAVEDIPEFGPLVLRIPLAEGIAVGEEALFRPGFFLVATATAERGIVLARFEAFEERDRLQPVAAGEGAGFLDHFSFVDGLLHRGDHELRAEIFDEAVAVFHGLGKIVPSVHVHQRKRQLGRPEGFFRQVGHNDGILAAGEQKNGFFKLCCCLAKDIDRFGLKLLEVSDGVICSHF